MNSYFTISILPDAEMPGTVIMNAIYSKLHKALYDLKATAIGVSFPAYQVTLGDLLRIHGNTNDLENLQKLNWLGGMIGYCKVSEIKQVPADTKFRTVSRKQSTMSQSKLKRLMKRGSISEEEIKAYKAKMLSKGLDNPYVELVSGSNGNKHCRYIEFGELLDKPVEGEFDQFGLSKTATVPWF